MEKKLPTDISSLNRREFLGLMAASAALAGGTACRRPEVPALPYSKAPERLLPGVPQHYATTLERAGGDPIGVIVTCHEGRPIKIEGNPDHPASRGAADPVTQAMILELYDPDRSQKVLHHGQPSTLEEFEKFADGHFKKLRERQGEGLAFLGERTSSPTALAQRERMLNDVFPQATWHEWEPFGEYQAENAFSSVTGRPRKEACAPVYDFEKADLIVSLGCDFLARGPQHLPAARGFAARRRVADGGVMNRLYVAEPVFSVTGAAADHRLALPPSMLPRLAWALASRLTPKIPPIDEAGLDRRWLDVLASDMKRHAGRVIVLAGDEYESGIHSIATVLNILQGGQCVRWMPRNLPRDDHDGISGLYDLIDRIKGNAIETLVMVGGNPVFDSPTRLRLGNLSDQGLTERLKKIPTVIQLSLYANETTPLCGWHIPRAHALESWGDTRALDGTVGLTQPLIAPLYGGLTDTELMARLAGFPQRRAYDILRAHGQRTMPAGFSEADWHRALGCGILSKGAAGLTLTPDAITPGVEKPILPDPASDPQSGAAGKKLELVLLPHPYLYDGRYANNGWLQETPEPITKLSWDNAGLLSPSAAARLGLKNGDGVRLAIESQNGDQGVELPVWIVPGMDDTTVAVYAGYGRTAAGRVGNGRGVNVYPLRDDLPFSALRSVRITPTGKSLKLATMQEHGEQSGRELVREEKSKMGIGYHKPPQAATRQSEPDSSLWKAPLDPNHDPQWAMAIDLSACIGCHACVVACQAENNIPIVGKEQIANGRIMQWLRVDRYFNINNQNPQNSEIVFQPLPCQQCETAPCEQVCPFSATTHSPEGLNEMTYNRCVGTRYCSNNCPFKVRHFNFFNYRQGMTPVEKMAMNPDVTVRMRGVMEKCTYCVQRIVRARVTAKSEGRTLRDGEVQTACQQACPTRAIVFGNQADPASAVAKLKQNSRNYALLDELNLRPRTTYLAKVRNPNPELET